MQGTEVRIAIVDPRGSASPCLESLRRLGSGARVEILSDPEECVARAALGRIDLVVVDTRDPEPGDRILRGLRGAGPPLVAVAEVMEPEVALEWFRRGAADCVSLAGEGSEALSAVVLEQLRRWRAARHRESAERRIRDLEAVNETVIRNMNSAVIVVDPDGRVALANAPAAEILGRSEKELVGARASGWFPDGEGRDYLERTLVGSERFKGAESLHARPDGCRVPLGISCAPIEGPDGACRGATATFQDLSELRQLQGQVLQTEKLASVGQLAAGIAHEINNPMGFIHANLFQMSEYVSDLRRIWVAVESLQKAVAAGDIAEVGAAATQLAALSEEADVGFVLSDLANAVRESQEGSERIRHIVQDLRDFSHRDTGERALADLNQSLDSTANIVWPMMKHLVVLEKQYAELPQVHCYAMQLKQVFMNLLVNAYQAIEEEVGDSGRTGRIDLVTESRGDEVVITVRDTGAGMEPAVAARIFDPFFTTKKVGTGTGLGLSTSYNIVKRHGGRIEVESGRGRGTSFSVVLPIDGGEIEDA